MERVSDGRILTRCMTWTLGGGYLVFFPYTRWVRVRFGMEFFFYPLLLFVYVLFASAWALHLFDSCGGVGQWARSRASVLLSSLDSGWFCLPRPPTKHNYLFFFSILLFSSLVCLCYISTTCLIIKSLFVCFDLQVCVRRTSEEETGERGELEGVSLSERSLLTKVYDCLWSYDINDPNQF